MTNHLEVAVGTAQGLRKAEFLKKSTIVSDRLRKAQKIHSHTILWIPLLGTGLAIYIAYLGYVTVFDIAIAVLFYTVSMLGITVGYHRLFAHGAFKAGSLVRGMLSIMGCMAAQGSTVYWVSNHRRHHKFSDQLGDPHSPHVDDDRPLGGLQGLLHAQFSWTFTHSITNPTVFASDLIRDKAVAWTCKYYKQWVLLGLLLPTLICGLWHQSLMGALSGFLWGGLVRLLLSYLAINSVNSVTHYFGSREYDTNDKSTNYWPLSILTLGESWHNNHHAFQYSAKFGHKSSQIDIGYLFIRLLHVFGLVTAIRYPRRSGG